MNPVDDDFRDYDDPDFDPRYDDSRDDEGDLGPSDYDEPRPTRRRRDEDWYDQPPAPRSGIRRLLLILAVIFVGLPLLCCGGLLFWSSMYKPFHLSNGQHLGGGAMNIKFDYEYKGRETFLKDAYVIVAQTADDITKEHSIPTRFSTRGTWQFSADGGPAEPDKSPVRLWLEKESFHGGRSKASNVITIKLKTN